MVEMQCHFRSCTNKFVMMRICYSESCLCVCMYFASSSIRFLHTCIPILLACLHVMFSHLLDYCMHLLLDIFMYFSCLCLLDHFMHVCLSFISRPELKIQLKVLDWSAYCLRLNISVVIDPRPSKSKIWNLWGEKSIFY